ncbi:MAG: hypothetical protein WB586_10440 [Chthoniobacterales bacterium]
MITFRILSRNWWWKQLSGNELEVECAGFLKHFSQLHVQTFDGVGRVNDHLSRVGEKRNYLVSDSTPVLGDRRQLFAQRLAANPRGVEWLFPWSRRYRCASVLRALAGAAEGERVVDQVDDAGLNFGLWKNSRNSTRL